MEGSEGQPPAVCGAILAGGRARRFGGRDKSSLLVAGRRIVERQLEALSGVASSVFVVGGAPERFEEFGLAVTPDLRPGFGPIGGLHTALTLASTPLVLVLACDLPMVDARFLSHLARSIGEADVCVPRDARGWHPLCACYAVRCLPAIAARLDAGRLKMSDALADLLRVEVGPDELAQFDPSGLLLSNVNTAEDYAALTRPRPRAARARP